MDATFVLSNGTPWDHLEETLDAAAAKPEMEGVFDNIKEELVSSDFRSVTADCNLDFNSSLGTSETFIKLVAWFDDEGTKFKRALDLVVKMAHIDKKNVKRVEKGSTPGQRLFDALALSEATRRSHAVSLDAGQAAHKHVSFSQQPATSGDAGRPAPRHGNHQRGTSPGIMLTGEFGFKPIEEQPEEDGREVEVNASPSNADNLGAGDAASSSAPAT